MSRGASSPSSHLPDRSYARSTAVWNLKRAFHFIPRAEGREFCPDNLVTLSMFAKSRRKPFRIFNPETKLNKKPRFACPVNMPQIEQIPGCSIRAR